MPTLCEKCPKRESCVELCEEAEKHTDQDYIPQRELPIGLPRHTPLEHYLNIYLTKTEQRIVTLLGSGLVRTEVCQVLKMSRSALRNHIQRLRKKCDAFDSK